MVPTVGNKYPGKASAKAAISGFGRIGRRHASVARDSFMCKGVKAC